MPASKLADPKWRKERARKAGQAAQSIDAHINALLRKTPRLTAEQKERLSAIFQGDA